MSRPCHLRFDSRAKYVQISKVLTLRPLSLISFPRDQWGSLIADYLRSILWPSWHPHLLSAHRYAAVQSVEAERNVRIKRPDVFTSSLLFAALCGYLWIKSRKVAAEDSARLVTGLLGGLVCWLVVLCSLLSLYSGAFCAPSCWNTRDSWIDASFYFCLRTDFNENQWAIDVAHFSVNLGHMLVNQSFYNVYFMSWK